VRFLADEGVDRPIVDRLRSEGHEVEAIAELDPGLPDTAVLELARRPGFLLLTSDKDFGELVFRQRRLTGGVVLLRLAGLAPERKAEVVSACIAEHGHEMPSAFAVLTARSLRIRRNLPL
jgi:predicted nuclease of predicted toxin-antitoxin system